MNENESIDERLPTKITNDLASLGDEIDNDQKVRKVIRALHHHGRSNLLL